ncbi:MAG TPA: tyrosine-type recombinase/integrase [Candidatus Limiplasma sp.]|nr:tyrosine-type recombinase/integrase [Candidatus Limiplasma sp.]
MNREVLENKGFPVFLPINVHTLIIEVNTHSQGIRIVTLDCVFGLSEIIRIDRIDSMGTKRLITKAKEKELLIEDVYTDYIDEKKALNKSPATISSANGSYKRWMDYLKTNEQLSHELKSVDASYIYSFCHHCLNEEMKPTTLNHYIREIRAFLYWCMEKKYFPAFKIKLVTEQEQIKDTYTDEEKLKMIERPSKTATFVEWRMWAMINWILATGNRASTVCNIKIGDVNFAKSEIYITKTKSNKASIIPLSPALASVIMDYIRKWRYDAGDANFLFPNIGEEELTVNALKHSLRKYNKDREITKTSVHALRHTFAKDWIRNTGDVFRLQKLLGHSTLEMTRRYVNMFSEDLKEGFETYNPLDKLKKSSCRTQKVKENKHL